MQKTQLQWKPIAILIILALIWGANMAIIKIGARELPSLFMVAIRSFVAAGCLFLWMKIKGINIFPSKEHLLHGIVLGLFFGTEFGLVYVALEYTTASRTFILLYTAPFFVALGAHFFLKDDRLNLWKSAGLILAFAGVICLFLKGIGSFSFEALPGDLMALTGGVLWGATTIYLKKFLSHKTVALQTLFYQVFFSAPFLIIMSMILETPYMLTFSSNALFSLFYQCIIVAFLSYLVWFELIHRYPASILHGFSFFTPVFGVILSSILIIEEVISLNIVIALVLVSFGMILVNHRPD